MKLRLFQKLLLTSILTPLNVAAMAAEDITSVVESASDSPRGTKRRINSENENQPPKKVAKSRQSQPPLLRGPRHFLNDKEKIDQIEKYLKENFEKREWVNFYGEIAKRVGCTEKNVITFAKKNGLRKQDWIAKCAPEEIPGDNQRINEGESPKSPLMAAQINSSENLTTVQEVFNSAASVPKQNLPYNLNLGKFVLSSSKEVIEEKSVVLTMEQLQKYWGSEATARKEQLYLGFLEMDYDRYENSDDTLQTEFEQRIDMFKKAFTTGSLVQEASSFFLSLGQYQIHQNRVEVLLTPMQISKLQTKQRLEKLAYIACGILKLKYDELENVKIKILLENIIKAVESIQTIFVMANLKDQNLIPQFNSRSLAPLVSQSDSITQPTIPSNFGEGSSFSNWQNYTSSGAGRPLPPFPIHAGTPLVHQNYAPPIYSNEPYFASLSSQISLLRAGKTLNNQSPNPHFNVRPSINPNSGSLESQLFTFSPPPPLSPNPFKESEPVSLSPVPKVTSNSHPSLEDVPQVIPVRESSPILESTMEENADLLLSLATRVPEEARNTETAFSSDEETSDRGDVITVVKGKRTIKLQNPVAKENKKPRKGTRINITAEAIKEVLDLPQPQAAEKLGVSISTLKRRYYELTGGTTRWPYDSSDAKKDKEARKDKNDAGDKMEE